MSLATARLEQGLSQADLAARCTLSQAQVSYFEVGQRRPTLDQLLRIARALDVSIQRLIAGSDRPGTEIRDIAIELRHLGLVDLWVADAAVPGAFRRAEEVVTLAVSGHEPDPRIVEAVPAALAWNEIDPALLRAFSRTTRPRTARRLAWLADIALAIDRRGGFPGGCRNEPLDRFTRMIRTAASGPDVWDSLGRPMANPPTSPLWRRWRINYDADLARFEQRARHLDELRRDAGTPERTASTGTEPPRRPAGRRTEVPEMGRDEILGFLEAIDVELVNHAGEGETIDLYLIGRSALILRYGLNLSTKDVDIVHFEGVELERIAIEHFGKGTANAERLGFYLKPVPQGLPPIPGGYCRRSEDIPGRWRVLRPKQPEPHDLAVTKLKRFHAKDRQDIQILCDSGQLDVERLKEVLDSAFMWADKDDPERDVAAGNLMRVIDYLEGKTRTL